MNIERIYLWIATNGKYLRTTYKTVTSKKEFFMNWRFTMQEKHHDAKNYEKRNKNFILSQEKFVPQGRNSHSIDFYIFESST